MESRDGIKIGDTVQIIYQLSPHYGTITKVMGFTKNGYFITEAGGPYMYSSSLRLIEKNEQNQITMKTKEQPTIVGKTKKAFHTFELEGRKVTIGVLGLENEQWALVGHSVCHPDDTFDEKLARKISIGRARSGKMLGDHILCPELALDYGVLKSIAHRWERTIKEDPTIIGIYVSKR